MTTHTFKFSPQIFRQRLRPVMTMMLIMLLGIPLMIWHIDDFDTPLQTLLKIDGIIAGLLIVTFGIVWLITHRHRKKLQQSTVTLTTTTIEHYDGQKSKQFAYQDIDRVIVHYNHPDTLIQVFVPNDFMNLWGMESMSELLQALQNYLTDTVKVEERQGWTPKWYFLIAVAPVIGVIAYSLGTLIFYATLSLIFLLSGIYKLYHLKQPGIPSKQRAVLILFSLFFMFSSIIYIYQIHLLKITIHPCDVIGRYIQKSGCVAQFSGGLYVGFLPDNETVMYRVFEQVKIRSLYGFSWNATRLYHDNYLHGIFSSTDGSVIATEIWDDDDRIISVWDVPSQTIIWQNNYPQLYKNAEEAIESFTISPNGQLLALGRLHEVILWNIATDQPTLTLPVPQPMAFSPDGSQIATNSPKVGSIDIWQVETGRKVNTLGRWERGYIRHLTYSLDGQFLLVQTNHPFQFYVWQLDTGDLQQTWPNEDLAIFSTPAISADGRWVASGHQIDTGVGLEGYIEIWRVADGTLLKTIRLTKYLNTPQQLNFSPDSRLLGIATSAHEVLIYDMAALSGEELYEK